MVLWPHAMPYFRKPAPLCRVWEMWHCCQPALSVSQRWGVCERSVHFSPEWTWASWSVSPCSKAVLIVTVVLCAVTAEEAAVPPVRAATLLSTAGPDSRKSPRGDPILFPLLVVAQWPVSEALSGRRLGAPLPPGLAEKAEWLFSSASRATKSGPAKSNIVACLFPSQHTEHWGYQIQRAPPPRRTISPRLSQHTNWKASFIREHCSCSQKVCLESIILNVQLIVKDFRQNWKVAVLICHFCFLVQTFNLFFI